MVTVLPMPRSARVRGSAASKPGGKPEGPHADDEALAGQQPGHRLDGAQRARVGQGHRGAGEVVAAPILLVWILRTSSS